MKIWTCRSSSRRRRLSVRGWCERVFVLTTNQKGVLAELKIASAAAEHGIGVYQPLSGHSRADLLFDADGLLLRVQCKWGRLVGDLVVAKLGQCRCSPRGLCAN